MGKKKDAAVEPEPEEQEQPEVWPDTTNAKTREIMEAHGIMGPRQMFADWPRAEAIFKSHGFEWKAPE